MEGLRRRRRFVAVTSLAGTGSLGLSLSSKPGSGRFYALTLGVAAIYTAGSLASGPLHLGYTQDDRRTAHRPVLGAAGLGVGTFAVFYCGALVARHIPILNRAISSILGYAHRGEPSLVLLTTLANGTAEEVFFRGALYAAFDRHHPVAWSTAAYALATTATRNPALVLTSLVMGTLFGLQRRATGGILAPTITHLTWSTLMLRLLPPLFPPPPTGEGPAPSGP